MTTKQYIRKRKSTRNFLPTPLDEITLLQIEDYANRIKPLFPEIKTSFKISDESQVQNYMPIKAPHYISIYSEQAEGCLVNAGFIFQQLDLYLSSLNLGSSWGGTEKTIEEDQDGKMNFIAIIAFGKAEGNPHREYNEFKRKSLSEITNVEDIKLDAARIAPSSTNSQPWYFVKEYNKYHVFCIKHNMSKKLLYEKLNLIDIGIALGSLYTEFKDSFRFNISKAAPTKAGYTYIGTFTL